MINFIAGVFIGFYLGLFLMGLLSMSKSGEDVADGKSNL